MTLIDSNLIIYAVQAEYKNLRQWIIDTDPQYSIISRVEVFNKTLATRNTDDFSWIENLRVINPLS